LKYTSIAWRKSTPLAPADQLGPLSVIGIVASSRALIKPLHDVGDTSPLIEESKSVGGAISHPHRHQRFHLSMLVHL
jgi:hypothetical protein